MLATRLLSFLFSINLHIGIQYSTMMLNGDRTCVEINKKTALRWFHRETIRFTYVSTMDAVTSKTKQA